MEVVEFLKFATAVIVLIGMLVTTLLTAVSLINLIVDRVQKIRFTDTYRYHNGLVENLRISNWCLFLALITFAGLTYQRFALPELLPVWTIWGAGIALAFHLGIQYLYRVVWIPPARKAFIEKREKTRIEREAHAEIERRNREERQARQAEIEAVCSEILDLFEREVVQMATTTFVMLATCQARDVPDEIFMSMLKARISSRVKKLKQ